MFGFSGLPDRLRDRITQEGIKPYEFDRASTMNVWAKFLEEEKNGIFQPGDESDFVDWVIKKYFKEKRDEHISD